MASFQEVLPHVAVWLKEALAEYYHVVPCELFVGVGSDDVISMAFLTFFNGKEPILFPDVTYSFSKIYVSLVNNDHYIPVCLKDLFHSVKAFQ